MIVNSTLSGYEIITHYAHGLQAGQIAHHISPEYRTPHWLKSLCAIIEHDDEQLNFERNNNVDTHGRPVDFTLIEPDLKDVLTRCERVIDMARHRSGWVTLMIAQHLEFLHKDRADDHEPLKTFFEWLHDLQIKLRRIYKINATTSHQYYQVLRFCDRLSLIISKREIPNNKREIEINHSINSQTFYLSKTGDSLQVTPWLFSPAEFTITTEVYELDNITFASSKELQDYLLHSLPVLKSWTFKKS